MQRSPKDGEQHHYQSTIPFDPMNQPKALVTNQVSQRRLILVYLLTAIALTPGGSSTVHIYIQTVNRTTQLTTLVRRISGIRIQSGQTKINDGKTV